MPITVRTVCVTLVLASAGTLVSTAPRVDLDRGALVRVDASNCAGGHARRASGFLWRTKSTIVTSLHVVIGCQTVGVRYPTGGGLAATARVSRVLRGYDLALLTVDAPAPATPLEAAVIPAAGGAQLTAWGYPITTRNLIDTSVRRKQTTGALKDLLNDNVRKQVQAAGLPSLDAEVLFLEGGHLTFGHSGAPLIDASGAVAAIVDGGLEQGAADTNWAISASRLPQLAASNEPNPQDVAGSDNLFSGEVVDAAELRQAPTQYQPPPPPSTGRTTTQPLPPAPSWQMPTSFRAYRCGNASLYKTRTREFQQLYASSDGAVSLLQLVNMVGPYLRADDRFDIYQDLLTGATVVVPAGAPIREINNACIADVVGQQIQMLIQVANVGPARVQEAALAFENYLLALAPAVWQPNPQFSYLVPYQRVFDGLLVNRKSANGYMQGPYGPAQTRQLFETLAVRDGVLVASVAIESNMTPQSAQAQQMCLAAPTYPGCGPVVEYVRTAVRAVIAAHLATFPIG